MRPKILDIVAFLISLLVLGVVSLSAYQSPGGKPFLQVKTETDEWVFPLDSERDIDVSGPIGKTTIRISDGSAKVLSSPCTEKTCIKHHPIHKAGEWVACLPNRVLITVQSVKEAKEAEETPDGISY